MSGSGNALDLNISENDLIPVLQSVVRRERTRKLHVEFRSPGKFIFTLDHRYITCPDKGFGMDKLNQRTGSRRMIDVSVRVENVFDVADVKSESAGGLQHQIQSFLISGINKDQTVIGINQMT